MTAQGAASRLRTFSPAHGETNSMFQTALRLDLKQTVFYNQDELWTKFFQVGSRGAGPASPEVMEAIYSTILQSAQTHLDNIVEISRNARPGGDKKPTKNERGMYAVLQEICNLIEKACVKHLKPQTPSRRVIVNGDKKVVADNEEYPGIPYKPDVVIAEVPSGGGTAHLPIDRFMWRQCAAFMEVKADPGVLPTNPESDSATAIVAEAADYARIIFAARPFQLFVYGMLLCGEKFCLVQFDRRGVIISSPRRLSVEEDVKFFVHVILRFTYNASSVELGQDPTVSLLEGHQYYDKEYPRFVVEMALPQAHVLQYITTGRPIWVSHSLLGRATHVWRVVSKTDRKPAIMKTCWRAENQEAESTIYEKIKHIYAVKSEPLPHGLANHLNGGDVYHSSISQDAGRVSTYSLRPITADGRALQKADTPDAILTRVILDDFGKPLWQYNDANQLGRVLLTALEAHRNLTEHGILHRDISVGNVLIKINASVCQGEDGEPDVQAFECPATDPAPGFLTDFELASINFGEAQPTSDSTRSQDRVLISGTPVFMASTLLWHLADAVENRKKSTVIVSRTAAHDVESLAWTIIYVVYRRILSDEDGKLLSHDDSESGGEDDKLPTYKDLNDEFSRLFGAISPKYLLQKRRDALNSDETDGITQLATYLYMNLERFRPLFVLVCEVWEWLKELPRPQPGPQQRHDMRQMVVENRLAARAYRESRGNADRSTSGADTTNPRPEVSLTDDQGSHATDEPHCTSPAPAGARRGIPAGDANAYDRMHSVISFALEKCTPQAAA